MRILKLGRRMGHLGVHAVVQYQDKYCMATKSVNGKRWIMVLQGPICIEMKQHLLNQLF